MRFSSVSSPLARGRRIMLPCTSATSRGAVSSTGKAFSPGLLCISGCVPGVTSRGGCDIVSTLHPGRAVAWRGRRAVSLLRKATTSLEHPQLIDSEHPGRAGSVGGSARKRQALELFRGLPRRYDQVATALSFGQDPRWRHAMVAAVAPSAGGPG